MFIVCSMHARPAVHNNAHHDVDGKGDTVHYNAHHNVEGEDDTVHNNAHHDVEGKAVRVRKWMKRVQSNTRSVQQLNERMLCEPQQCAHITCKK